MLRSDLFSPQPRAVFDAVGGTSGFVGYLEGMSSRIYRRCCSDAFFVFIYVGHENCTFHHDLELDHKPPTREALLPDMARSYRLLLGGLGENPDRQGLIKTPERAAKAMLYFTKGYDQNLEGECSKYNSNMHKHKPN